MEESLSSDLLFFKSLMKEKFLIVQISISITKCCEIEDTKQNVKILSILFLKTKVDETKFEVENFVFGSQIQKKIYKQHLSDLSPKNHSMKKTLEKDYEMQRSKDPQRKKYKQIVDQERDQTEKRKSMRKEVDHNRDKTPKRKL